MEMPLAMTPRGATMSQRTADHGVGIYWNM
uniref:Uncharacterized protein n=1 Tax=Arundo donax TaxID=35708 RepID=A0A0A9FEQ4_ARUDO